MKKRAKIILIIVIILILIIIASLFLMSSLKKQDKTLADVFPFLTNGGDSGKAPESPGNTIKDTISEGTGGSTRGGSTNGGSGGGGTGSDTTPLPSNGCFNQQISYSIRSFNQVTENNLLNCSLIVTNLDESVTGEFEINFIFEDQNQHQVYAESLKKTISSKEEEMFSKVFDVTGQEIVCKYKTVSIPKKEIC
jgi:hypothetical protein